MVDIDGTWNLGREGRYNTYSVCVCVCVCLCVCVGGGGGGVNPCMHIAIVYLAHTVHTYIQYQVCSTVLHGNT